MSSIGLQNTNAIPELLQDAGLSNGYLDTSIPQKGMIIIAQKHNNIYGTFLVSPRENFDLIMNEIKPTIDSIRLDNTTDKE